MQATIPFAIDSPESINLVFEQVFDEVGKKNPKLYLSNQTKTDLRVAFVEAVANAIKHAGELKNNKVVEGKFCLDDKAIGFDVYDHGDGYSPESVPTPNLNDFQASGRGVFMMKQLGDRLEYKQPKKGKNTLMFRRNLIGESDSARELDLLYDLSEAIIRKASLDEVYEIILDQALELFHVERASILIYDHKIDSLKVVASRGISREVQGNINVKPGEGVSGYVFQHGRPLLIEDIEQNKRGIEKKEHYKTGSFISAPMICSPLRLDEQSLGVINLTDRLDGKKFSKKDLKILSTIANQAMACLYIRGLVDKVSKSELLKKEVEAVRKIQRSYLPDNPPDVPGYDVAGRCAMAQSVGGDYFDYYLHGEHLYLVVADVSGHDMSSAVTMVNYRSQLKVYLASGESPGGILTKLNNSILSDLEREEQFVSCLLVKIELKTGEFTLASAGHYPPLFPEKVMLVKEAGLVMGVLRDEKYIDVNGSLPKGESMVLFTDGVIESMDTEGKMFGMDTFQKFISDHTEFSSDYLVNKLVDQVLTYRSSKKVLDDITVVVIKRN
jgi:phosphoserine phosphatase RsbU/P